MTATTTELAMSETPDISVVIPLLNESESLPELAAWIDRVMTANRFRYEAIFIDDGSSDRTKAEIERAAAENPKICCISYQPNQGKGGALREGTAHATGDYIAFCDADLDLAPEQLADFIDRMQRENADVVIGSKMHPESKVDYPAIRRVYSWGYYILLLILFRLNVRDTQTGLKLFKAEVIKPVMRQILVKRFAFDIEVLAIINARGYKITSAPIEVVFHRASFGRIGYQDIRNMFVDTLAIFYRLHILHYYDKADTLERS